MDGQKTTNSRTRSASTTTAEIQDGGQIGGIGQKKKSKQKSAADDETEQHDDFKCGKCGKIIKADDADDTLYRSIQCERCDVWVCLSCAKLQKEEYDFLSTRKDLHWYCKECEVHAVTAVSLDKDIEARCSSYLESVSTKITNMEEAISKKADSSEIKELHDRFTKLEHLIAERPTPCKGDDISSINDVESIVKNAIERNNAESRDIESRKCNILIHNVKESTEGDAAKRKSDDTEVVKEIFEAANLKLDTGYVRNVVRLGKKAQQVSESQEEPVTRPRLMKVTFKNSDARQDILRVAPEIRHSEKFSNTFVSPDMTPTQRQESKKLREELLRRRDAGEKDITIKNWKIVKKVDVRPSERGESQ